MKFNQHYNLQGQHAMFGASTYSWLNYDKEHLINFYHNMMAKERGTQLHELAAKLIEFNKSFEKPRGSNPDIFKVYVRDAIGYKMTPEVPLYYSDNFFGTADAISFRDNFLRIHDLKTGKGPVSIKQLLIYAAFFCLEYEVKPEEIEIELRIYQNDAPNPENRILVYNPEAQEIRDIMSKIVEFDKIITKLKIEEE